MATACSDQMAAHSRPNNPGCCSPKLVDGNPVLVSLSGGNPALQALDSLTALGRRKGHSFALETQAAWPSHRSPSSIG